MREYTDSEIKYILILLFNNVNEDESIDTQDSDIIEYVDLLGVEKDTLLNNICLLYTSY